MKQEQYRQGDVLIERCTPLDAKDLVGVPLEAGRVVLAHGEATGHAHALPGIDAMLFSVPSKFNARLLRVLKPTELLHEEHHRPDIGQVIALKKGDHRVIRQREWDETMERVVAD